jgi:DNA-binding NarL/FixJ family response regulator
MKAATVVEHALPYLQHAAETRVMRTPLRFEAPQPAHERGKAASVHLTPRQVEVLSLLCEGLPNKLICRRLNISTGTVKVHISGILRELGVTSRLQAVVSARRSGLVDESVVNRRDQVADGTGFVAA